MKSWNLSILAAIVGAAAYVGSFLAMENSSNYPAWAGSSACCMFYYPLRVIKWTRAYPPERFTGVVTSDDSSTFVTTFQDDRPGGKEMTIVCGQSVDAGMTRPGQRALIQHSLQIPFKSYWPEQRVISVTPLPDLSDLETGTAGL